MKTGSVISRTIQLIERITENEITITFLNTSWSCILFCHQTADRYPISINITIHFAKFSTAGHDQVPIPSSCFPKPILYQQKLMTDINTITKSIPQKN